MNDMEQMIEDRILKVLEIYPKISPSMLQIGIGSSIPSAMWRPVFQKMLDKGTLIQDDIVALSSTERHQIYRVIRLASGA